MAQLYDSNFQTIDYDEAESLLTLTWKQGTKEMNYPQFQGALFVFAGYAQQKNPGSALIDGANFYFEDIPEQMWGWRGQFITPLYGAAGITKFGFLLDADSPIPEHDGQSAPGDSFPTRWFHTLNEALVWFRS